MIAANTSSLVAFFQGEKGDDVDAIEAALRSKSLFLPPPVLTELLSEPSLAKELEHSLRTLPLLAFTEETWVRAGKLRANLIAKKLKARLSDSLIAASCLEHNITLITRDNDFRHFKALCGLKIIFK